LKTKRIIFNMEKELKINTADSLKEKLWIGIPVVLLVG
jgi:hypothetical protein